jgi:hypothetical protein
MTGGAPGEYLSTLIHRELFYSTVESDGRVIWRDLHDYHEARA